MKTDELFFSNDERIFVELEELKQKSRNDAEKIKNLSEENAWLLEQIKELSRNRFDKKSERWESQEQLKFNEAEVESIKPDFSESAKQEREDVEEEIEVPGHKRKRGHRKPLPESLPREIVKIELPIEEQFAVDGTRLKVIGWEMSEKLKYEPAKMSIIEYQRARYGFDSGDYEKTAPQLPSIIPKGIATPELLAAIIVSKYADALPLYRMEDIFLRSGIELSRGTMARWVIAVAKACQPIWNILSERWRDSFYVSCDETRTQVLKEKDRKAEAQSWMWVRSTPYGPKKIILFDYSVSRSGAEAAKLFLEYKGTLQCDGLESYSKVESEDVIRIGCNMHGRSKFEKAVVNGAKAGQSLGERGLSFYKIIYDLEEEIKNRSSEEKYELRLKVAKPVFEEMKAWVEKNKTKVPKKSKISQAFTYFQNEYEYLIGYLKDGRFNPDNGFTERAIRKFAIGRNNWMFSDTEAGADASALLYSLVVSAKVNGVNPYRALVKVFAELPNAKTIEDFEALTDMLLIPEQTA
jgi:transposase